MSAVFEVEVYRSNRKADTYLLVRVEDGLSRVPEELVVHFGEAVPSFRFELTEDRRMPRIDAGELRARLIETGFWLQLPPPSEPRG